MNLLTVTNMVSEWENFIKHHPATTGFHRIFWVSGPLSYFVFYNESYDKDMLQFQICVSPTLHCPFKVMTLVYQNKC